MNVSYKRLTDLQFVKESLAAVRGKKPNSKPLSLKVWHELLLSPHSPTRVAWYRIYVEDVSYYAHVHLVRHKIGIEPTVYSQRSDKNRKKLPQDTPISLHFDINAQALLNISKVRLCNRADSEVRELLTNIKSVLTNSTDEYDRVLGRLMMSNCELYDGICPEPNSCGKVGTRMLKDIQLGKLNA